MKHSRHRIKAAVFCTAALFSAVFVLEAAWIPLKAQLAQQLIARNWEDIQSGSVEAKPWPWADTRTAARLHIPLLERDLLVLDGNSGRNLAFGPAFSPGTSQQDDMIIHGHRDTHFRSLDRLKAGDLLQLETAGNPGKQQWYEVVQTDVVDSSETELVIEPGRGRLSLVTCYPLRSLKPGGKLRYVVTALPVSEAVLRTRLPSSG